MQRRYVWLLVAVVLVCAGWTAVWFYASSYGSKLADRWIAREAALGRTWDCRDREIAGYPFRFVIRCSALSFEGAGPGGKVSASFGAVRAITQVYNPKLLLAEADGPLKLQAGGRLRQADASWKVMRASIRLAKPLPQRVSVRIEEIRAQIVAAGREAETFAAKGFEFHLRPAPDVVATIGAVDLALRVDELASALVDQAAGVVAPVDAAIALRVTRAPLLFTGPHRERLERWRQAGGNVTVRKSSVSKGPLIVEASGLLEIDEEHRVAGKINTRTAGAGVLMQRFGLPGSKAPTGGLLGGLLGGRRAVAAEAPGKKLYLPMPLMLRDGAVWIGPFRTGIRLRPLY